MKIIKLNTDNKSHLGFICKAEKTFIDKLGECAAISASTFIAWKGYSDLSTYLLIDGEDIFIIRCFF